MNSTHTHLRATFSLAAVLSLAHVALAQVSLFPILSDTRPIPGLPAGYTAIITGNARISARGTLMIPVELDGPGIISGENSSAILTGSPAALSVVARGQMFVPGAPAGSIVSLQSANSAAIDAAACSLSITLTDPDTFDISSAFWLGLTSASAATPGTPLRLYGAADPAPALPGATISSASSFPSVSSSRRYVGFVVLSGAGVTSTTNQALLAGLAGQSPVIAARQGDSAPGIPANEPGGPAFLFLRDQNAININAAGQVLFRAALVNGSGSSIPFNPSAIYRVSPGASPTLVAREGDSPGSGATLFGAQVSNTSVGMNTSGVVAFQTQQGNGSGNFVIWSGLPGALSIAARSAAQTPDLPAGVLFATTNGFSNTFDSLRIADTGAIVFLASLSGTGVIGTNSRAIFAGPPGAMHAIARLGDQAPGAPAGATFNNFTSVAISASGHVAFSAADTQSGGIPGLWAQDRTGALRKVARAGDVVSIAGTPHTIFSIVGLAPGTGADGLPCSFSAGGQLLVQASFTDGTGAVLMARLGSIADFNGDGTISVQDIFDFLAAWFAGSPAADINGNGLSVQDIFDFLNDWFAGI